MMRFPISKQVSQFPVNLWHWQSSPLLVPCWKLHFRIPKCWSPVCAWQTTNRFWLKPLLCSWRRGLWRSRWSMQLFRWINWMWSLWKSWFTGMSFRVNGMTLLLPPSNTWSKFSLSSNDVSLMPVSAVAGITLTKYRLRSPSWTYGGDSTSLQGSNRPNQPRLTSFPSAWECRQRSCRSCWLRVALQVLHASILEALNAASSSSSSASLNHDGLAFLAGHLAILSNYLPRRVNIEFSEASNWELFWSNHDPLRCNLPKRPWRNEAIVWWGKGELIIHLYLQILAWTSWTQLTRSNLFLQLHLPNFTVVARG